MTSSTEVPERRLDSWKAISDYLARDERTVRRWEKDLGLPVRRVPGGRGHSVFAYVTEIDAWLRTRPPVSSTASAAARGENDGPAADESATTVSPVSVGAVDSPPPAAARTAPALVTGPWPRVATIVAATTLVLGANVWTERPHSPGGLTFDVTSSAIVATDAGGAEQWRYAFPPSERIGLASETPFAAPVDGNAGVYTLISNRTRVSDGAHLTGQLLLVGANGEAARTWSLDDQLTFGAGRYDPPWSLLSFRIDDRGAGRRIAVAAHHYEWWPGLVTVLDEHWRRTGTFVNAGWIESAVWTSPNRLLVSGFSNSRDAGMVALLDADAIDGQSPERADSKYRCLTCGSAGPLRYLVFPRSEINAVTGSEFNRARLSISGDRIMVRTEEATQEGRTQIFDALYEFSPALDLIRASYSDRYWELHRTLEAQGKIHHTRDQCPDRDGPREIQVWEPATGWRSVKAGS